MPFFHALLPTALFTLHSVLRPVHSVGVDGTAKDVSPHCVSMCVCVCVCVCAPVSVCVWVGSGGQRHLDGVWANGMDRCTDH